MVGNRAPTDGSSAESPRLQRRHSFGLGVLVGLAIAAILGLVLVAPIALAHHDASSLETAYGNAVITGLSRLNAGNVGANPTTASAQKITEKVGSFGINDAGPGNRCRFAGSQQLSAKCAGLAIAMLIVPIYAGQVAALTAIAQHGDHEWKN